MEYKKLKKLGRTLTVYEDGRIYRDEFTKTVNQFNYLGIQEGAFIKQSIGSHGYRCFGLKNESSIYILELTTSLILNTLAPAKAGIDK